MNTSLDCIPCLLRQALDAIRLITPDENLHRSVLHDVLDWSAEIDLRQPPIILAQRIHRYVREITGVDDPYFTAKLRLNKLALNLLPEFSIRVATSPDPLMLAVRIAVAGNVIDMGIKSVISEDDVLHSLNQSLSGQFLGMQDEFRYAVSKSKNILYLADNAGEIVFDRLLIEQLPASKVTLAVRGGAIINDATRTDAIAAGLNNLVAIVDNGSDAPGTLLPDCSAEFLRHFNDADLIISKGQGNYESLSETTRPIFFLFKVKCPIISQHAGYPLGSNILTRAGRTPAAMETACES
jgi:hypothetical protein